MPLWKVERDGQQEIVKVDPLPNGRHEIEFGGLRIPVDVTDGHLKVDVLGAHARHEDLSGCAIPGIGDGTYENSMGQKYVTEVELFARQDEAMLILSGVGGIENHTLNVEHHNRNPITPPRR